MSRNWFSAFIAMCVVILCSPLVAAQPQFRQQQLMPMPPQSGLNAGLPVEDIRPLAMTKADFDEDGTTDLLVSYQTKTGGLVKLYRGNVDAIFPFSTTARASSTSGSGHHYPFHSATYVARTDTGFDFLVSGDFNADGHIDIAGGALNDNIIWLFSGDGNGALAVPEKIWLGGALTALEAGDVNRRDGLQDIVAAIDSDDGAELLVFENPNGALATNPERFSLPSRSSAITIAEYDGRFGTDVVVASGKELVFVGGRDRKLALDSTHRNSVSEALTMRFSMPSEISGLAAGSFSLDGLNRQTISVILESGDVQTLQLRPVAELDSLAQPASIKSDVAPLSWHQPNIEKANFNLPAHKIKSAVAIRYQQNIHWLTNHGNQTVEKAQIDQLSLGGYSGVDINQADVVAALSMRLNQDGLMDQVLITSTNAEPVVIMGGVATPIIVNTSGDDTPSGDGLCSLREAIINANNGGDVTGGECGPGNLNGADTIEFAIAGGGSPAVIHMTSALPDITDTLIINGNSQCAGPPCIKLDGASVADPGDYELQALTVNTGSSVIRGLVFANWPYGAIELQGLVGGNFVEGNYIGVDFDGATQLPLAGVGVDIFSPDNTVGGTTVAARNIISSLGRNGIGITNSEVGISNATGNTVMGNHLGTDNSGSVNLGSALSGIYVAESSGNTIGGTTAGSGNLVSGNGTGVLLRESDLAGFKTENNLVQGNLIGTDLDGTSAIGNKSDGIYVLDAPNNTIGGTVTSARNVISANGFITANRHGVNIVQGITYNVPTTGNLVQGNFIGTDITGTLDMGNAAAGVLIANADSNTVGGDINGSGNVISGNEWVGVYVVVGQGTAADGNVIQGNLIGTDVSGTQALGNVSVGVYLHTNSSNTLVGGTGAGAKNVISGNYRGIHIQNSINNTVQGNFVGTNSAGTAAIPNQDWGLLMSDSANGNQIGGIRISAQTPAAGNLVSGNGTNGIGIFADSGNNKVQGNFVGSNALGTAAIPNGFTGVMVSSASSGNLIGGETASVGNLVSGNLEHGMNLATPSIGVSVKNNLVGLTSDGLSGIPNGNNGIVIGGSSDNEIGVLGAGNNIQFNVNGVLILNAGSENNLIIGNEIANNTNDGIVLVDDAGSGNTFSQNQIYGSGAFGIDLGANGVDVNDNLDPDVGYNNFQNYPVIDNPNSGGATVSGSLNSLANTQFTIEYFSNSSCSASGFGEGQNYLGSKQVTTDGAGNADISTSLTTPSPVGHFITATATGADGSTSEFSACSIVEYNDVIFANGFEN